MQLEEAMRALDGLSRLARLDASGNTGFGRDLLACRRSFLAYVLILPALLLALAIDVATVKTSTPVVLTITEALAMVIQFAGFPLLVRPLLKLYGRLDRWAWFITGYNWFSAAQTVAYLAVIGLWFGPLAGLGVWPILLLQLYFYVVEAFLAEAILAIGGVRAGSIVLLDGLFGYLVEHVARWIGGGGLF
jgi:hypothetical protein